MARSADEVASFDEPQAANATTNSEFSASAQTCFNDFSYRWCRTVEILLTVVADGRFDA